ncbi:hypothetical protein PtrSN002B_007860 [Pyrenophora tritici-repentis]|uniref:Serine-threonine protein kinase n=1 Tax=Pyrenophora tritici-repentis TaxID=45151 RepID=A0A2W1E680_9PLEO|nr:SPS1 Serine-threonine protein kinase [Pyrenophora tritici-repentis]KAF7443568.1 SPS1 Serine-threonine protein kinase [Pyrenophora tritici-repentis]KAG9379308.1 SPS1 Serine-threonine protein kinase [Pyrenophora tritici-repentis]KAI0573768.1 SPS1 Serine-threonine protein kinase [Pyrenophora tritici-repentis]KAI0577734.1 SPS1 Serine-threonine protein kinase [Pyrenophora tritici-repentis]
MAELAIGSISFFFQVFAGCIQGYELIADACHLQKDCQALLVNFKIEQQRLLNWARTVGLDYRDDNLVLNHMSRGLMINIMEQQQKLLFSFGRMNKKYEKLSDPLLVEEAQEFVLRNSDMLIENGTNGSQDKDGKFVRFPPPEELVRMSVQFVQKFREVPKRLKWATFDQKKMEFLVSKLANLNDKMHEALDKAQTDRLIEMQQRANDQLVLLNRKMSLMVQIYQSQQTAGQTDLRRIYTLTDMEDSEYNGLADSGAITAHGAAHQPLAALAQQNFIHLAIEDSQIDLTASYAQKINMPDLPKDIHDTQLSFDDIHPKHGDEFPEDIEEGSRTEAFYHKTPVWIEWKTVETFGPRRDHSTMEAKIHARVKKLAALLSKNNRTVRFRAPFCRGYFIDTDESRFGLVFEKPASISPTTEPTSLHTLLTKPDVDVPSLTSRITLMRLLAETVERLHAVDWLHKGLRSANILLFPHNNPTGEMNYTDPFISGFDYSRPATNDELSETPSDDLAGDLYRHPSVQSRHNREDAGGRESYKKSFDLYSLGIVLLEIAYWKPIDVILGIDLDEAVPRDTRHVQRRLLNGEPRHLGWVRSFVGDTVEAVVRACLSGPEAFGLDKGADEKREVVAAMLQREFGERVVGRFAGMKGL